MICIDEIRHLERDGFQVVRALVNEEEIWLRSRDVPLRAGGMPFACLFLMHSLSSSVPMRLDGSLEVGTRERFAAIGKIVHDWWDFQQIADIEAFSEVEPAQPQSNRRGLFFTCGVDSFFTLFEQEKEIDDLILVWGFDVALADAQRFALRRKHATAVAEALGKRLIVVETNLREHTLFKSLNWEKTHGAALAAVGHMLGDEIGHFSISASFPVAYQNPWGSSPHLDRHWSTGDVQFAHVNDALWRSDKLKIFGGHPLVQKHLAVCWRGQGEPLNCGVCEKCVRTRLALLVHGHLRQSTVFQGSAGLADAIHQLAPISKAVAVYDAFLPYTLPDDIRSAIESLLERSKPAADPSPLGWDTETLLSRIEDVARRKRFEGGSPNKAEIKAYEKMIPSLRKASKGTAIVLGMTPELRTMASRHFAHVLAVDRSPDSISLFTHWVSEESRSQESIFNLSWDLIGTLPLKQFPPVSAIFGDGIFCNLPDIDAHRSLLASMAEAGSGSPLIVRKLLAADAGDELHGNFLKLLADFREKKINAAEFGYCSRFSGFLDRHYDPESGILRNGEIFSEITQLFQRGLLSLQEYKTLRRYQFGANNCLLTREKWECLLVDENWDFRRVELQGRRWFPIAPLYCCTPKRSVAEKFRRWVSCSR